MLACSLCSGSLLGTQQHPDAAGMLPIEHPPEFPCFILQFSGASLLGSVQCQKEMDFCSDFCVCVRPLLSLQAGGCFAESLASQERCAIRDARAGSSPVSGEGLGKAGA